MVLLLVIDQPTIEYLNSQGYKIDTAHGQEQYEKSIAAAIVKSSNLNSKLKQKLNQIETFNQGLIEKRKSFADKEGASGFEAQLATISFHLGFAVDDAITLAKYNEYVKIIHKQNGPRTQRHNNG